MKMGQATGSVAFDEFVLAASTADLGAEPRAREHADAVEFRLDLASDGLAALAAYDGELPVIATNRLAREGGEAADTDERLAALCRAVSEPAVAAVDVELDAIRAGDGDRVVGAAREHDVAVVVSVHDFEATPPRDQLRSLLGESSDVGTVAKLAVTATTAEDVLDLLAVTRDATAAGETVATMAMGAVGRHSRVVAPLYGSRLGYAPVDPADATAPGQYDLRTFRQLYARLQTQ